MGGPFAPRTGQTTGGVGYFTIRLVDPSELRAVETRLRLLGVRAEGSPVVMGQKGSDEHPKQRLSGIHPGGDTSAPT